MEYLKRDLSLGYDFSVANSFRTVDIHERGAVDIWVLDNFMRRNGLFLNDFELMAVIRRLDTLGDAQVSYEEFVDFMKPDSNFPLYKTTPAIVYTNPYLSNMLPTDYYARDYPMTNTVPRARMAQTPTKKRSKSKSILKTPSRKRKVVPDDRVNLNSSRFDSTFGTTLARSRSYFSPFADRNPYLTRYI